MSRYSEVLLEHARRPRNWLPCSPDTFTYCGIADLNGHPPRLELYVNLDGEKIVEAKFCSAGCAVMTAIGSVLTGELMNRHVDCIQSVERGWIDSELGGIPEDKRFCLTVAFAAIEDMLGRIVKSSLERIERF